MRRLATLLILCAPLAAARAAVAPPTPEQVRFFEAKVRPLLVQHCHSCHGPKKASGGLRLDSAAGLHAGGDTGRLIDPTKPDDSLLLRAVRHQGPKMPPKKKLPDADVRLLAQWVRQGAPWPADQPTRSAVALTATDRAFWAFRPVREPALPAVKNRAWPMNPIDHFVLARLEARGIAPVARADRRTLARRLSFDLTGLPPAPEEVEAFAADTRPDAWPRLVDRLLASPAYGER
jgi:mono/diheme cytochrome c family protein